MSDRIVLDRDDLRRTLVRIAHEIIEKNPDAEALAIVGIHSRGAVIGRRLHGLVCELSGAEIPLGDVDISFYRDDLDLRDPHDSPVVNASHIDFDAAGRTVVLVDDVLHTGRTVRAAIECLQDHGRPARVWLAALCDRGGRELPVAPDFVGRVVEVEEGGRLDVWVDAAGPDRVVLTGGDE